MRSQPHHLRESFALVVTLVAALAWCFVAALAVRP
jgi:hypothetical protein